MVLSIYTNLFIIGVASDQMAAIFPSMFVEVCEASAMPRASPPPWRPTATARRTNVDLVHLCWRQAAVDAEPLAQQAADMVEATVDTAATAGMVETHHHEMRAGKGRCVARLVQRALAPATAALRRDPR
jgi:hypothetical protein